jgi:peptidyl-prolyl cis-trans isomerase SurA
MTVDRTRPHLLKLRIAVLGLILAGGWLLPRQAGAQNRALVDRVAAEVGDSVILLSQIEERIFQLRAQGAEVPPEGSEARAQLQRDVLDQMIGEQLIVQAAARDTTISVDDLRVQEAVAQEINQRVSQMGGQQRFEEGLARQGFTLSGYRDFLRGQIRQERLYQQFMTKQSRNLASVVVEESEIREAFEERQEVMGERPPTVELAQIILAPSPSDSVWEAARQEAARVRAMAAEGEDFAELAERFSDDGSAEQGGDLGWFRRGDMVEEFEESAFNLPVDQISQPVRSPFGYHIIKVTRRRSGEVRASHILFKVDPSPSDLERARELAGDLRNRLQEGGDFAELREEYGDTREPDSLRVPFDRLQELPPGFAEPLSRADAGDVLEPVEYRARGEPRIAVIKVVDVLPAGPYSLSDPEVRSRMRQILQQEKLVDRILEELRSKTYIRIHI